MIKRIVLGEEAATRWAHGEVLVQEHLKNQALRVADKLGVQVYLCEPSSGLVLFVAEPDDEPPTKPYHAVVRKRRDTLPYGMVMR